MNRRAIAAYLAVLSAVVLLGGILLWKWNSQGNKQPYESHVHESQQISEKEADPSSRLLRGPAGVVAVFVIVSTVGWAAVRLRR